MKKDITEDRINNNEGWEVVVPKKFEDDIEGYDPKKREEEERIRVAEEQAEKDAQEVADWLNEGQSEEFRVDVKRLENIEKESFRQRYKKEKEQAETERPGEGRKK